MIFSKLLLFTGLDSLSRRIKVKRLINNNNIIMKLNINKLALFLITTVLFCQSVVAAGYQPTAENLKAREEFAGYKFGIFLHWGIYSTFAQGEWYMQNRDVDKEEYAKAVTWFLTSQSWA